MTYLFSFICGYTFIVSYNTFSNPLLSYTASNLSSLSIEEVSFFVHYCKSYVLIFL